MVELATVGLIGGKSLDWVVGRLNKWLDEGKDANRSNVQRTVSHLAVVREGVLALENEALGILSQAKVTDVDNKSDLKALAQRVGVYLEVHTIRPELRQAVTALDVNLESLEHQSAAVSNRWSARKDAQRQALSKLALVIIDTKKYLDGLSQNENNPLQNSGVARDELERLQAFVLGNLDPRARLQPEMTLAIMVAEIKERELMPSDFGLPTRIAALEEELLKAFH